MANKCRCLALFADDEKRGRARRRLVSSTIRDESARGDPGPPGPRRCRSAMCCAQLDALQVEKRIGVSGSRTHLASGTASGRPRGPSDTEACIYVYSFLLLAVPLPNIGSPLPSPVCPVHFYFHLCVTSATRSRDVIRKLTRFRV